MPKVMYINGGAQLSCEAAAGFVAFVKVNDIEYPVPYSLACNNGRLEDGAVPVDRVECINKPLCATCPPFETTEDSGLIPGPLLFDVNGCAYHNMKCSSAIYNKIINNMMATRVTDVKLVCSPEVEWKTNYGHPVTTTSISCLRRPCWDCDTMAFRKGAVLEPMNADDLNECMRLDLTKACDDSAEMMLSDGAIRIDPNNPIMHCAITHDGVSTWWKYMDTELEGHMCVPKVNRET
ncbi:hypothetical protein QR680_004636 [Steinernema hermaphroditum]|uniref:Uncharacterized protein n=1 Tax=Steinernema hermaphroditum TaxID=289476 RepID=A0AA39LUA5_9BILA|nr:hypothetical protein QR680_004636 [Steinernema hermaphroditum]